MTEKIVRIGGASGFAGDSQVAVPQLLRVPGLNYLVFDYLAEPVLGRLALARESGAGGGFFQDFIDTHLAPNLAEAMRRGVRLISNAGGFDPRGCAAAIATLAASLGLAPRIAVIEGDNLTDQAARLRAAGHRDMFTGAPFPAMAGSINAYLGAFPIAAALDAGADIVITGRVVDSAVTLGALIHEFGWRPDQHDLLAAGTLAGHMLECGPQCTGGTFTDWRDVPGWEDIGYPVAECREDGSFVLTKPEGTGGLVSIGTAAEQILYEVSDPQCYFVPDVTADFSAVTLRDAGPDRVALRGARGLPPTGTYKVCVTYDDGWRVSVLHPILGLEAVAKAERQAAALIARSRSMLRAANLADWTATHVDVLGAESNYGAHAHARQAREVIARITLDHADRRACTLFAREHRSSSVSMSVGKAKDLGASIERVGRLFCFLLDKRAVTTQLHIDGTSREIPLAGTGDFRTEQVRRPAPPARPPAFAPSRVPLIALAWARSGDKGDLFNVGVIARQPEFLPYIAASLTPEALAGWYAHLFAPGGRRRVDCYVCPGFSALNFVVHESLDGGGLASRRIDPNAKGMAQMLLEFPVEVPRDLALQLAPRLAVLDARPFAGRL